MQKRSLRRLRPFKLRVADTSHRRACAARKKTSQSRKCMYMSAYFAPRRFPGPSAHGKTISFSKELGMGYKRSRLAARTQITLDRQSVVTGRKLTNLPESRKATARERDSAGQVGLGAWGYQPTPLRGFFLNGLLMRLTGCASGVSPRGRHDRPRRPCRDRCSHCRSRWLRRRCRAAWRLPAGCAIRSPPAGARCYRGACK